ncbi:MAG: ATP-binding protein, partial [bacterium]
MNIRKKQTLLSTIERIQADLQSNPENVVKYLHSQQLANIGNMVGGIAHTFNNILGGILGYAQLLKEELPQNSDPYRHAAVIEKAAKRASKLLSQLHIISNKNHIYQKVPIDPIALVEEVVSIIKSCFPRNIRITTAFHHDAERILADFPSMCQVLMNICLNAKESMPHGGDLKIQTDLARKKEVQNLCGFDENEQYVVFKISDTGSGIKKKDLPHIFEPFFSTKGANGGSGFGLTIVEAIVKDLHGGVSVCSRFGKGSSFIVYLPSTVPVARVRTEKLQGKGEVILVVDDEEDLREMAKKILERKGFRVLLADTGPNAIKVFEENAQDIQLVLLDMILPGIDGAQVYQKLKKNGTKPKIILTSGYTKYS